MKSRLILLCLAFILITRTSNAQFIRSYGIKAGSIAANQTWNYTLINDLDTKTRWGFVGGVYLEILDVPYFSVVGEVDFLQKGSKHKIKVTSSDNPDGNGEFITLEPKVDYLSIPIMGKLRFDFSSISVYAIAGPRFDILINKDPKGFDAVINKFSQNNYGITIGTGAELNLQKLFFLGEIRYSPVLKNDYDTEFLSVRNNSLEFILGIGF